MNDDEEKLQEDIEEPEIQENQEDTELQEDAEDLKDDPKDKEIESLKHELAVSRADFYNFRQRTVKERQETRRHAQEDLINEILPVLDNLNRALDAANSEDTKSIVKGVEMVQRQFMSTLENLGVKAVNAKGENFDPSLHDASGTEEVDDPELDGKVITEILKGYKMNDRVLRPSRVTVGKYNG